MSRNHRKCQHFNCDNRGPVHFYHVCFDLYCYLCSSHASNLIDAKRSPIMMIEFLTELWAGGDRDRRARVRRFVLEEIRDVLDEENGSE